MFCKRTLLVLAFLLKVNKIYLQDESHEYIKIKSEIDLVVWDLEDKCTESAKSYKYMLSGKPNGLKNMIDFELELGQYLRTESHRLLKLEGSIPYDLQRNFTILTKCGDFLLAEDDWKLLVTFANKNEDLQNNLQTRIYNETEGAELRRSGYEDVLKSSKDIGKLERTWSAWQERHISKYRSEYPAVLQLVNKAAKQNDFYNAKSYWEKMSDYEDLYSKVDNLWREIEPTYKKLHNFVGRRINHYHGTNYSDFIPLHLLGSTQGDDWSNIADIVLPHPQLLYDINHNLLEKDITEVYRMVENITTRLNLGKLSKTFWKQSDFNSRTCESHVLTYCSKKLSQLVTCPNVTLTALLAAHTDVLHVIIDRLDYSAYTQLLRTYPTAVTEAALALGDLFAVANLERYGLVGTGTFSDGDEDGGTGRANRMNAMLLLALRLLPKLAYWYEMDVWRLGALEEDETLEVAGRYWDARKKFSGVEGLTNEEASYLNDGNILRNKPLVNKFVAGILQFQILNYYQIDIFAENSDVVNTIGSESSTFISMLQERPSRNVPDLLSYHYSIDDISAYPLIEFFTPLFEYLETVPIEQNQVIPKIRTTTATTTTTSTATPRPVVKQQAPKEDQNLLKDAPAVPEASRERPPKTTKTTAQVQSGPGTGASSKADGDDKPADTGLIATIVVIVTLSVCLVAALLWKKYKRKPRTNNRRFDT